MQDMICHGYCPIRNSEYFITITYYLFDINAYVKGTYSCCYPEYRHVYCPFTNDNCPIFLEAKTIVLS